MWIAERNILREKRDGDLSLMGFGHCDRENNVF
jgi:hypothetical protein